MIRRRFFLFRVILSCWAGRGKTLGKTSKSKASIRKLSFWSNSFLLGRARENTRKNQQKQSFTQRILPWLVMKEILNAFSSRNGVELCFLGESTTPHLYPRGRRYPFDPFEPEPNLKCIMRPYYYPLGGGSGETRW